MRIMGLFDYDEYVKVNDLKEVKSSQIYSSQGVFNDDGLFSEVIFGQTADERDNTCGFIKLPIHVFNPHVAKTIIMKSGGIIKKMAYGEVRCNIDDGRLVADDNGKYCGLKDLYSIWDEIDIRKTLKTRSEDSVTVLVKSPKKLIWTDKILVLPPNMRPIGERGGKHVKSELNTLYMNIIGLKSVVAYTTAKNVYQVYNKFQDAVINTYVFVNNYISGKNGFFQKNMLAKVTMFSGRNVISAPRYNNDNPEIGVFRTGYPLETCCSLFKPLVAFQMKQFLSYDNIVSLHPNSEEVKRNDIVNIYDDRYIDDLLDIYIKNPGSRFMILYLDPEKTKPILMDYMDIKKNEHVTRPMTLTDVCYLCSDRAIVKADRMVYTVRYPIGDYLGAFFTKVHILSTTTTRPIQFQDETYRSYPVIDVDMPHNRVATSFDDTITMSNSRLEPIGGDYDGDTVKSTGIWSDEANAKAEELMYSKIYNVTPQGKSVFNVSKECLNGLYALTKMPEK